ncbi:phage holin family protein [Castellaniella sp.]|uniref:phage holin family protein n=1 Tax=Castellaniella sp. TaxID=1955812 RepID=UPI003A925200
MAAHIILLANLISVAVLMCYRRGDSRYKPWISILAYLLLVSLGGQAIDVSLNAGGASAWDAAVSTLIAVVVVRARGNVAAMARCGL